MGDKLRNVAIRTLSGAVLLAVVLAAAYISPYTYAALLLLICVVGMVEFYKLARKNGAEPQYALGLVSGVVLFVTACFLFAGYVDNKPLDVDMFVGGLLYFVVLIPICFIAELFAKSQTPMRNIAATLLGVWYVAFPLTLMLFIPLMLTGGEWRAEAFLFYLFIVWANDVFAFLVGITCGRHRLCERISPKKSWEGFFGGIVGALAMGAVGAAVVGGSYGVWLGMAGIVAVTGVLGDLVESMFKREADVKDSGNIMPGHGGMLDRFDSIILCAPLVYLVSQFLTVIS